MLHVSELTQKFGQTVAVKAVSFQVSRGEVVGLLGPNGAGKTTTMRIITGYLTPTAGEVRLGDEIMTAENRAVRRRIGYLPENNPLYDTMRVYEYLEFMANSKHVAEPATAIHDVVHACALTDKITSPISELSKGYRQRVGLAAALLGNPDILILDEPTSGLDPNQAADVRDLIRRLGKNKSILFSTHILHEVQAVCDRALIIDRGQVVAAGTMAELTAHGHGQRSVIVTIDAPTQVVTAALKTVAADMTIEPLGQQRYRLHTSAPSDLRRSVYQLCVTQHWDLLELQQTEISLEDIFRQLTTT